MIRAIISDFGGVLIRDVDNSKRVAWAEQLGVTPQQLNELIFDSDIAARAAVGQFPVDAIWRYVKEMLGLDADTLAQLREDFWWGDRLDMELFTFLCGLRGRYRTAILSNAWSDARARFINHFGLDAFAEVMIISAEVKLAKPDPRIYQLALEALAVAPVEALFLDDVSANVEAARALGMHAILHHNTPQTIVEIQSYLQAA